MDIEPLANTHKPCGVLQAIANSCRPEVVREFFLKNGPRRLKARTQIEQESRWQFQR